MLLPHSCLSILLPMDTHLIYTDLCHIKVSFIPLDIIQHLVGLVQASCVAMVTTRVGMVMIRTYLVVLSVASGVDWEPPSGVD